MTSLKSDFPHIGNPYGLPPLDASEHELSEYTDSL